MKRIAIIYCAALCAATLFGGCEKNGLTPDFLNDPTTTDYNKVKVYIYDNYGVSYNSAETAIEITPVEIIGGLDFQIPVKLNKPIASDVQVALNVGSEADVEAYNTEHKTQYKLLPAASYLAEGGIVATIAKDTYASVAKLATGDLSVLESSTTYLLPLTIGQITSAEHRLEPSVTYNTYFITVAVSKVNIKVNPEATAVNGTVLDRTLYAFSSENVSDVNWKNLVDGDASSDVRISGSAPHIVTDLSKEARFIGVNLQYYSYTYCANRIQIETSLDKTTWESQGQKTIPLVGKNQFVELFAPVNARYVRITFTDFYRGTYGYLAELTMYEAQ